MSQRQQGVSDQIGYSNAHKMYESLKVHMASRAYAPGSHLSGFGAVTIKMVMVTLEVGKSKHTQVGNVLEALDHVPVDIGARPLKKLSFVTLFAPWKKWSRNYPYPGIDEFKIRFKTWGEITPLVPDINVLLKYTHSQTSSGKLKLKSAPAVDILLEVPLEVFRAASRHIAHLETQESPVVSPDVSPDVSPIRSVSHVSKRSRCAQTVEASTGGLADTNLPLATASQYFPSAAEITRALGLQGPPSKPTTVAMLDSVVFNVQVQVCPYVSFAELVKNANGDNAMWSSGVVMQQCHLTYSSGQRPMIGASKMAHFGNCSPPPFPDVPSAAVVIKQVFVDSRSLQPEASDKQISDLTMEILCARWANALMGEVYDFIRSRPPPANSGLDIPSLRYVYVALAMEVVPNEQENKLSRRVFLLEERINEKPWVKYINNDSPTPRVNSPKIHNDPELIHIAYFLSFCQHVQYLATEGRTFVSDFQGGRTLLSDPQIMTTECA
ncbi:uncharacterized protein BXZ73DRAFT_48310 [Epithele typhae]|uniref:uncharacterized protein n=1 Tax=Epithele typhae TaxID=378194 RepID=UPI0020082B2B|nr:uncharacterized protein BXZ73DRAFT_48310 [Epithele typhae]KAH9929041.1 hypothetical protein BXZ73DRAFT_48310 [Epithele typhae]